jgi:hypothetical protein
MFRVLSVVALRRVYPRGHAGKRFVLLTSVVVVLVAGCGGGGGGSTTTAADRSGQRVEGDGFSFYAPKDWTTKVAATTATASRDPDTLVSVTVLPLTKRYKPALFPRVVAELDRVAKALAAKLGGELTSSRSIVAGGRRAREYEIAHGDLVDRITFVLRGKREYELVCRWRKADGEPAACDQLAGSFSFR